MIRIDSDTHFTPLDAFDEIDPRFAAIGPRFERLPSGRYRVVHEARAPFVPEHIKPLRLSGHPADDLEAAPRIDAMAKDGFDMQVLIPNNAPFYYDVDGAMGASVSRSFNKAISRIHRRYSNKFIGVATAPLQDIRRAIAETVRRRWVEGGPRMAATEEFMVPHLDAAAAPVSALSVVAGTSAAGAAHEATSTVNSRRLRK